MSIIEEASGVSSCDWGAADLCLSGGNMWRKLGLNWILWCWPFHGSYGYNRRKQIRWSAVWVCVLTSMLWDTRGWGDERSRYCFNSVVCLQGTTLRREPFDFHFFSSQTLILVLKLRSDPQFWHVNCKYDTLPALYTVIVFEKLFLWNSLSFWCRNKSGLEVSDKRENKIGLSVSLCCHHWTSCLLSCLLSCSSSLH